MTSAIPEADISSLPRPLPSDLFVLDVRERDEWEAGHIEGAVNIPLMHVLHRIVDIPLDQQVLVVCKVGARSAHATALLSAQGRQAVNLAGGMWAWQADARPMVASGDTEPAVI